MSDELDARLNRFMDAQEAFNEQLMSEVGTIKRGVYGDEPNQTPGALSRITMLEVKVKKLFSDRKKVIWVGSTAVVVVGGLFKLIELFLK